MKQSLINLGFSEKEIEVYIAVLELGQANVLEIANQSGIPRATVYNFLEPLLRERFIGSVIKGKRRVYYAENPQVILQKVRQKEESIQRVLPAIKDLYLASTPKPVIRTYEGREGILKMLDDILKTVETGGTYDALLNYKDEFAVLGKRFDNHVEKRKKKKIWIRLIAEQSGTTRQWKKTEKEDLRSIRYIPRGQHFSVSYHIYGNKVSMFSLQGPIIGVIIENKQIAEMERLQFEYMWKGLKK